MWIVEADSVKNEQSDPAIGDLWLYEKVEKLRLRTQVRVNVSYQKILLRRVSVTTPFKIQKVLKNPAVVKGIELPFG